VQLSVHYGHGQNAFRQLPNKMPNCRSLFSLKAIHLKLSSSQNLRPIIINTALDLFEGELQSNFVSNAADVCEDLAPQFVGQHLPLFEY
jgi:hypothetical protein